MSSISADEYQTLRRALPAATAEQLFETYRISETTWRKLREGRPVKRVTLERVRTRFTLLGKGWTPPPAATGP